MMQISRSVCPYHLERVIKIHEDILVSNAKSDSAGGSGGGDGDDDGCESTGYSINDLVAEDADDPGASYNRGGGVAA